MADETPIGYYDLEPGVELDFTLPHSLALESQQDGASFAAYVSPNPNEGKGIKRRRNCHLTLDVKMKIINEVNSGRSKVLICKEYGMSHSTLFDIMKRKEQIEFALQSSAFTPQRKRLRACKYGGLEHELWLWHKDMAKKRGEPITGPEICAKAVEIAAKLQLPDFNASNGWLYRFKARKGISAPKVKEETVDNASDGDSVEGPRDTPKNSRTQPSNRKTVGTDTWTQNVVPEILKRYEPKDIFVTGETSLFYRCSPDKMVTYLNEDCSDGRFAKDRLTVFVATNILGTEKLPALAIGKYGKPRCFKNIKTIPTEYMANVKSWMIPLFFEQWIRKLDSAMQEDGRSIVLFATPTPAHPRVPDLKAISLIFLPPSPNLQPASQGILQTLKQNYRKSIIQRRLHFAEVNGRNEKCHITLVDALHWLRAAWKDVSPRTIFRSFQSAEFDLDKYKHLVPTSSSEEQLAGEMFQLECDVMLESNEKVVLDAEYSRMFDSLAKSMVLDPFITAESYASLDDQVVTFGHMTEEELQEVVDRIKADEEDDEEEEEPKPPPPTFSEAKQCLAKLAVFFASEPGTEQYFDKISTLYQRVRQIPVTAGMSESIIIDLFSKNSRGRPKSKKPKKLVLEVENHPL